MREWISDHQGLLWILGSASIVIFIASLFLIPAIVVQIRPDYFTHKSRPPGRWASQHRLVRIALLVGKNALGVGLIVAGIAMLLLPGQGILTLIVGFFLVDFPGKYRLEKWLMARRWVHRPINWLRKRRGKPPLQID